MDVSIIIVNFNTCQITLNCIESILNITKDIQFEIIVVDNASNDYSESVFSKDKRLTYIRNNQNIGFGRANNVGIEIAKGRNILFLNSDTLLINNAIKILSDYLDSHEETGAVGGNLFNKDMDPTISFQLIRPSVGLEINNFLFNVPLRLIYGKIGTYFNTSNKAINVGYIMGADLMVKKEIIDKIGGFDPRFFMYFEETDLCRRINKDGKKIKVLPDAKIIHLEGQSIDKDKQEKQLINPKRIKLFEESRVIYYKKNSKKKCRKIAMIIYYFSLCIHPFIFKVFKKTNRIIELEYKKEMFKELRKEL